MMRKELRDELVATDGVTLDGRPAVISGSRNDYATVRSLDGKLSGEWAWVSVQYVVEQRNKAFKL